MTADLQRHILVNVARSKAFSLSSEPQVGDALSPEIQQTSLQIDELLRQLAWSPRSPEDLLILERMKQSNHLFTTARQELTTARDGGVTAKINQVFQERFNPAATQLQETVSELSLSQRAKIDGQPPTLPT